MIRLANNIPWWPVPLLWAVAIALVAVSSCYATAPVPRVCECVALQRKLDVGPGHPYTGPSVLPEPGELASYVCGICGRRFELQPYNMRHSFRISCLVNHPIGECCHFGETEIKEASPGGSIKLPPVKAKVTSTLQLCTTLYCDDGTDDCNTCTDAAIDRAVDLTNKQLEGKE